MKTTYKKPSKIEQKLLHDLNQELACTIALVTEAIQNGYKVMSPFEYAGLAPTVAEDISDRIERVNDFFSKLSIPK